MKIFRAIVLCLATHTAIASDGFEFLPIDSKPDDSACALFAGNYDTVSYDSYPDHRHLSATVVQARKYGSKKDIWGFHLLGLSRDRNQYFSSWYFVADERMHGTSIQSTKTVCNKNSLSIFSYTHGENLNSETRYELQINGDWKIYVYRKNQQPFLAAEWTRLPPEFSHN